MAKIPGTAVASPLVPIDSSSTTPTHSARYGKGGLRGVATIAALDDIPASHREHGMLVFVEALGAYYQCGPGPVFSFGAAPFVPGPSADTIYPNTSSGLAAVGEGEYFYVATSEGLKLYRDVAGAASFVGDFPSLATLSAEVAAAAASVVAAGEAQGLAESARNEATEQAGIATTQAVIATNQAGIATTQAGEAANQAGVASGHATQSGIFRDQARAAADATAPQRFFDTYADALAAISTIPDDAVVEVFEDENQDDHRTRYLKEPGNLVLKVRFEADTILTDLADPAPGNGADRVVNISKVLNLRKRGLVSNDPSAGAALANFNLFNSLVAGNTAWIEFDDIGGQTYYFGEDEVTDRNLALASGRGLIWQGSTIRNGYFNLNSIVNASKFIVKAGHMQRSGNVGVSAWFSMNSCRNVEFNGLSNEITAGNGIFTVVRARQESSKIWLKNLNIDNSINGGGIEISDTEDIFVLDSDIFAGDDALVLKTFSGGVMNNVVADGLTIRRGAGLVRVGSQVAGNITNVAISNCNLHNCRILRIGAINDAPSAYGGTIANWSTNNINLWLTEPVQPIQVALTNPAHIVNMQVNDVQIYGNTDSVLNNNELVRVECTANASVKGLRIKNVGYESNPAEAGTKFAIFVRVEGGGPVEVDVDGGKVDLGSGIVVRADNAPSAEISIGNVDLRGDSGVILTNVSNAGTKVRWTGPVQLTNPVGSVVNKSGIYSSSKTIELFVGNVTANKTITLLPLIKHGVGLVKIRLANRVAIASNATNYVTALVRGAGNTRSATLSSETTPFTAEQWVEFAPSASGFAIPVSVDPLKLLLTVNGTAVFTDLVVQVEYVEFGV